MTELTSDVSRYRDLQSLQPRWGWMLFLGVALMLGGFFAASYAVATSMVGVMMFGLFLTLSGAVHLFAAIFARGSRSFFWTLLTAVVSLAVGIWMIIEPVGSMLAITWLFAIYFIVSGVLRVFFAVTHRDAMNWGWVAFSGLLSIVLGAFIYAHWPLSGLWIIGLYIGVDIFLSGLSLTLLAFAARNA